MRSQSSAVSCQGCSGSCDLQALGAILAELEWGWIQAVPPLDLQRSFCSFSAAGAQLQTGTDVSDRCAKAPELCCDLPASPMRSLSQFCCPLLPLNESSSLLTCPFQTGMVYYLLQAARETAQPCSAFVFLFFSAKIPFFSLFQAPRAALWQESSYPPPTPPAAPRAV